MRRRTPKKPSEGHEHNWKYVETVDSHEVDGKEFYHCFHYRCSCGARQGIDMSKEKIMSHKEDDHA